MVLAFVSRYELVSNSPLAFAKKEVFYASKLLKTFVKKKNFKILNLKLLFFVNRDKYNVR